jgi:hypothetical protein
MFNDPKEDSDLWGSCSLNMKTDTVYTGVLQAHPLGFPAIYQEKEKGCLGRYYKGEIVFD